MTDQSEQSRRGFALSLPGDPLGVSCDAQGPSLGPIRLLERTAGRLTPRKVEDLDTILSATFGKQVFADSLMSGLAAVARALEAGDITRAIFATQFMRLPQLTPDQANRALASERLTKASPDDEDHPGWPKGTPDGKGGQYRPKDGFGSDSRVDPEEPKLVMVGFDEEKDAEKSTKKLAKITSEKVRQLLLRKALRIGIADLLSLRAIGRDLADKVTPIAGDVLEIADLFTLAREFEVLSKDAKAAEEFLEHGTHTLDELRVSSTQTRFESMDSFVKFDLEKRYGPAGEGYEYHHIVEQGYPNANNLSGFDLNATNNIVRIPKLIHEIITGDYARLAGRGMPSLRSTMNGKSFDEQFRLATQRMKKLGIIY